MYYYYLPPSRGVATPLLGNFCQEAVSFYPITPPNHPLTHSVDPPLPPLGKCASFLLEGGRERGSDLLHPLVPLSKATLQITYNYVLLTRGNSFITAIVAIIM